jgi:hypothetical protein
VGHSGDECDSEDAGVYTDGLHAFAACCAAGIGSIKGAMEGDKVVVL